MIDWSIEAVSFGNSNCDYGCPCQHRIAAVRLAQPRHPDRNGSSRIEWVRDDPCAQLRSTRTDRVISRRAQSAHKVLDEPGNYGGSTGYGRAYSDRLQRQWMGARNLRPAIARSRCCEPAWNKDVFGVIGIQSGPPGQWVHSGFHEGHGSQVGDAGSGDDREDPSRVFRSEDANQGDLPRVSVSRKVAGRRGRYARNRPASITSMITPPTVPGIR
jgi:hypothetical protein